MGYDYIIRVAVNYKEGTYNNDLFYPAQQLFETYRQLKSDLDQDSFYIHLATDGHGGSLCCGFSDEHITNLFKFTSFFPAVTFTFYNQNFDFTSMDIIVIKEKTIMENKSFSLEDKECLKQFEKYGLTLEENEAHEVYDEEDEDEDEGDEDEDEEDNKRSTHEEFLPIDPRNIRIHNEISRLFYDEQFGMTGGLCFGPTFGKSMGQCLFGFKQL
jgi:hypothetical protein